MHNINMDAKQMQTGQAYMDMQWQSGSKQLQNEVVQCRQFNNSATSKASQNQGRGAGYNMSQANVYSSDNKPEVGNMN